MGDWIALAALVFSVVMTIVGAAWHISSRINNCVKELTTVSTKMSLMEQAFQCSVQEHSQFHKKLEDHGQKIVGLQGEVRAIDGRVTRIEDEA